MTRQEWMIAWCILTVSLGACSGGGVLGDEPVRMSKGQTREVLMNMGPRERQHVARNFQEFLALTPEKREEFRRFHNELQEHPEQAKLMQIMANYHDWLQDLNENDYLMLKQIADPAERLQKVRQMIEQENKESTEYVEQILTAKLNEMSRQEGHKTPSEGTRPVAVPTPTPTTPNLNRVGTNPPSPDRQREQPKFRPQQFDIPTFRRFMEHLEERMRTIGAIEDVEDKELKGLSGWDRSRILIFDILPKLRDRTAETLLTKETCEAALKILVEDRPFEVMGENGPIDLRYRVVSAVGMGSLMQLQRKIEAMDSSETAKKAIMQAIEKGMSLDERQKLRNAETDKEKQDAYLRSYLAQVRRAFVSAGEIPSGGIPKDPQWRPMNRPFRDRRNRMPTGSSEKRPTTNPAKVPGF